MQADTVGDIAVIGMACRLPGANDYRQYWRNLIAGRICIKEVPASRWRWQDYWGDPKTEPNRCNCKWGGFLDDIECFDRAFFGLSVREVESMDPQQRMALELAWSCFEDASIRPSSLSGTEVGVFIGASNLDYKEVLESRQAIDPHYASGIDLTVIPNRISYYFNLRGPSLPVSTACSSSLQAMHLACRSLQAGECVAALVGGISLLLTPRRFISFSKAGMLSPTGALRAFDDRADGMLRGEGGGMLLLKPLERAVADQNKIIGLVKGSAINHSGKTYSLTYPSAGGQAEVIAAALRQAGVTPADVSYVEAHGTGTPKGDPVEIDGLLRVFARDHPCDVGSVKPNIGHLEAAAGIAAAIKVLLCLEHAMLPPSANFQALNARIPLDGARMRIVDRAKAWDSPGPRMAGVSSFGFAGTNAHLILQQAPEISRPASQQAPSGHILCLSANTTQALLRKQREMLEWLRCDGGRHGLASICAGLIYGREHFAERLAIVGGSLEELTAGLEPDASARGLSGNAPEGLNALAVDYGNGVDPARWGLYPGVFYAGVPLPAYPFEKTICPAGGLAENMAEHQAKETTPVYRVLEKPRGIRLQPLPEAAETASAGELASLIEQILERVYEGTAEIEKIVEHMSEIAGMDRS